MGLTSEVDREVFKAISDRAWASGLFEGEGCFTAGDRARPYVTLSMVDEDVVRKFHEVVGVGNVTGPYQNRGNRQPYWRWQVSGVAAFTTVLSFLEPGLGYRRRRRAEEVLARRAEWELAHG